MRAATLTVLCSLALAAGLFAQDSCASATMRTPLGGPATVPDVSPNAFGFASPTLSARERRAFVVGNAFFKDNWVQAPASATGRDGLGPLFNARSCSACHFKDGRGRPPEAGDHAVTGLLLRLGVSEAGAPDGPHPVYGGQLQDRAIHGVVPEARFSIEHDEVHGTFADGTIYELRAPRYVIDEPGFGVLDGALTVGPRVAPQLIGLGLLEAVPAQDLIARADPDDADGDGVSGRAHMVHDVRRGELALGRFGWKATQPTVEQQSAAAFVNDMGLTNPLFPDEALTATQIAKVAFVSGGSPEVDERKLGRVAFYCQTLAVPAQRTPDDPEVARGEELFEHMGCVKCHVPELRTGKSACVAAYREVVFRPYTDLLLHDMGEALADGKRDGDAGPGEWRTPPLWGIGLFDAVNGHTRYLHDGRARNLEEAVLWHGGEAATSQAAYRGASRADREALIAFLRSL